MIGVSINGKETIGKKIFVYADIWSEVRREEKYSWVRSKGRYLYHFF